MKSFLRGLACALVTLGCSVPRAGAWQQPSEPPSPATPQEPGAADAASQKLIIPEAPKIPNLIEPDERGFSLGVTSWRGYGKPWLMKGTFPFADKGDLQLQGRPNDSDGWFDVLVNLPGHNALRVNYWAAVGHGSTIVPNDVVLINQSYSKGDYLDTDYRMKSARVTFEYLTWPYPVKNSRFRLKTTWGMQYFQIRTGFSAPFLPTTDDLGNPLVDSSGNPVTHRTQGTQHYYLPMVGFKIQEYLRPTLRLEFGASGFGIPHHANSWDSDASLNWRFAQHFEFEVGAKAFHFRSSAKHEFWARGTQFGPTIGVRWYSASAK